jgi:hypothetical protein
MNIISTNSDGIPYLTTTNVIVSDTAVSLALGFRPLKPCGLFVVRVANAIPDGTTGTLPVSLTLNGISRPLTFFGGQSVTAADLSGTGVILVFNDKINGILQVIQTAPTATAATNSGS